MRVVLSCFAVFLLSVEMAHGQLPPSPAPPWIPATIPGTSGQLLTNAGGALGATASPNITTLNGWSPQFGISDSSSGTPATGGTGNAVGDELLLNDGCSTHGVVVVAGETSGAVTGYTVTNYGSCANVPANPVGVLSSTGSGTGASFNLTYAPLAAHLLPGSLTDNLSNLFLTNYGTVPAASLYGSENVLVGTYAGGGFGTGSSFNTVVGSDACGIGTAVGGVNSSSNVCIGTDAARNMTTMTNGGLVVIGAAAAENITEGLNTIVGNGAAPNLTSGNQNVIMGWEAGGGLSTGNGNVVIGNDGGATAAGVFNSVLIGSASNGGGNGAQGGSQSVIVGARSGNGSLTGSGNTIIGTQIAPSTLTTGCCNILIGTNDNIDAGTDTDHNAIVIGTQSGLTTLGADTINIEGIFQASGTGTASTSTATITSATFALPNITTATTTNCGSLSGATACVEFKIGGATHYVPYY